MENYDWNELVDRYVDDECSVQERALVEARALEDAEVRRSIEWATKLRELLVSQKSSVPQDFSDRLQAALKDSPSWADIEDRAARSDQGAPRVARESISRARMTPVAVGTAAAVAAVVAFGLAFHNLRDSARDDVDAVAVTPASADKELVDETTIARTEPNYILTPSAEGVAAKNEPKKASQDQFWTVVAFADESGLKSRATQFQRECAKLNLSFSKYGNNREYLLKNASSEQWRQLAATLDENAERETSDALRAWCEAGDPNGVKKNIRVTFDVRASNADAQPDE